MTFSFLQKFLCISSFAFISSAAYSQEVDSKEMAEVIDVAKQLAGITSEEFLKLVRDTQDSVVVIETQGRDGRPLGIGSGFIVSEDGLIATNLHVIGEARPVRVYLKDGREFAVTEIHGTDKTQDVALVRIDANELTPLIIGKVDALNQGQPIFAIGNPRGLRDSVVTGVVSGFHENDEGMSLIQLAIPIEKGNSGGPLMDMKGRVHGLLTLKSQVTENLGYAVRASAVRKLLDSPNPIPMARWMTIGTLNSKLWDPRGDVSWKHRAGVISVEGSARGFGGRALCLSKKTPPETPYELAVDVKIQEEDGAAGLVFHSDGEDIHYGFYPSSGALRISRFDGPTVYSWHVLHDERSRHFRPNEWNRLKVRIEKDSLKCYCNDELVFEHLGPKLDGGRIGIVKFRHTTAEFKRFKFALNLPDEKPSKQVLDRVAELANRLEHRRPPNTETVAEFSDLDPVGQKALRAQAKILEQRAEHLRRLASEIHERQTRAAIVKAIHPPEDQPVKLLRACLLISLLDNSELDIEAYEDSFDQLVEEFISELPESAEDEDKIDRLGDFLFKQHGFHGSHANYYHASNSYLNEVIDDREGLPLTLSILYVELARRAGLDAAGVGLPGHFIAKVTPSEGKPVYVDAFDGGKELSVSECRKLVRDFSGLPWRKDYLDSPPSEAIIQRMLRNLIRVSNNSDDKEASLRYVRTILEITPDSYEDRLYKAVLCYSTDRIEEGLIEVDWVLNLAPSNLDLRRVRELREAMIEKQKSS